jgi:hypothetical protein
VARIRSIKPELRTSLTVADWPREVRYLWVLLWGYLDDHGRGVDDPRLIKADCLPLDEDVTRDTIDRWIDLIAATGPLCRYQYAGRRYIHAPNWSEHQRPSHPAASRIPVCPVHDLHEPPPEILGSPSGDAPETLVPEQVVRAGSREQGAGSLRDAREPRDAEPAKRATRIPDDFTVTPDMATWARQKVPDVDGPRETEKFVNYWRAKSGSSATKLDWPATWRNWMLTAAERAPQGRASPRLVEHNGLQLRPETAARIAGRSRFEAQDAADQPQHAIGAAS